MLKIKTLVLLVFISLVANLANANVLIDKMIKPFVGLGTASGVVIKSYKAEDKYWTIVLTGWHVIDEMPDKKKIPGDFMEFDDNGKIVKRTKYVGFLSKGDKGYDYAFITFNTDKIWDVASIDYETKVSLFDELFIIGRPNGEKIWITKGLISSLDPPADMKDKGYFGTNSGIHFGNSGGPIFNKKGQLIGLALRVARNTIQTPFGVVHDALNHIGYGLSIVQVYDLLSEQERRLFYK